MTKSRSTKGSWDAQAAEVLAGRGSVDAGGLIDLIHQVNPTGRGRGPEETAARYALKSRLQSFLIRKFARDLDVLPDPVEPGVAALRHRYRRHDACHAVIATLDEDARSWVQRELDLAEQPASSAPAVTHLQGPSAVSAAPVRDGANDARSAEDLLRDGKEAQDAYDYEEAQRCFSGAVQASGGAVPSALAFLSFAVDALAADEEALAIERALPPATLAHPAVALLLAIASARSGDEARALRHLGRARDARAAEPLVLLAQRALDEADPERAARRLREAEEQDPAHPGLRVLGEALTKLRAKERAPREAELGAHIAAGRDREAGGLASAILARWPESEPARRALRQIEERQRTAEGRKHLVAAEEAAARGESKVALEHLHKALACPLAAAEREAALGRVRQIEAAERDKAARERAEHVAALLAGADRTRGLVAYAELSDGLRREVRARDASPTLGVLDDILAALPSGRSKAAVDAALALERAAALADKDASAAAALLTPHERALERVPLAGVIADKARAAAAEERHRRAIAALKEAEGALAEGHFGLTRELLSRLDVRALSEAERAHVEALSLRLASVEERHRLVRRCERLRAAGSFAAARGAALDLAARSSGAEHERWAAEAAAIPEHVRGRFPVKTFALSGGPELLQHPALYRHGRSSSAWVADGGRELVLCTVEHAWMFLRVLDIESGQVVRAVRVAIDASMHDVKILVHAGGVSVLGGSGLFEVTLPDGEIVRRFEREWRRSRGSCFMSGAIPSGSRMLWGYYDDTDDREGVKVVDVEGELGGKSFPGAKGPYLVAGAKEPRLALFKEWADEDHKRHFTVLVCDVSGAEVGRFDTRARPTRVVAHPSGAGLLLFSVDWVPDDLNKVTLVEISERFEVVASHGLGANICRFPAPEIVCALDAGMVWLRFKVQGEGDALVALRAAGPGLPLAERYRIKVPARTTLAHDTSARRAFAVVDHAGGLSVTQLAEAPPALPESGPIHQIVEPFQQMDWCAQNTSDNGQSIHQYASYRRSPEPVRRAEIERWAAAKAEDPHELNLLFYAMIHGDWDDLAEAMLARLRAIAPGDPRVLFGQFTLIARRHAFRELSDALEATGPEPFTGPALQHYHHLRAMAFAALGELGEARRHLDLGKERLGFCGAQLEQLRAALDALVNPVTADDLGEGQPAVRQLIAVLHAADERLSVGDAAGAIAVLERPLVWDLCEVQSLARLAAAYLELPSETPGEALRKALTLATFLGCVENHIGGDRREMLAPGVAYAEARIESLRRAALAWMEADQGAPRALGWCKA